MNVRDRLLNTLAPVQAFADKTLSEFRDREIPLYVDEESHIVQAQRLADAGTAALFSDGRFLREKGDTICWVNQRLPLALLRLHAQVSNSNAEVVPDLSGRAGETFVK